MLLLPVMTYAQPCVYVGIDDYQTGGFSIEKARLNRLQVAPTFNPLSTEYIFDVDGKSRFANGGILTSSILPLVGGNLIDFGSIAYSSWTLRMVATGKVPVTFFSDAPHASLVVGGNGISIGSNISCISTIPYMGIITGRLFQATEAIVAGEDKGTSGWTSVPIRPGQSLGNCNNCFGPDLILQGGAGTGSGGGGGIAFKVKSADGSGAQGLSVLSTGMYLQQATANLGVGFGMTSPSAKLHLAAGTTSANTAPLKFTSGADLTTPEAGAFEFSSSRLAFTPSGTTRKRMLLSNDVTPSNGQIPIGNGTDYTISTITAGSGVTVTNGTGTITISAVSPDTLRPAAGTSTKAPLKFTSGTDLTTAEAGAIEFGSSRLAFTPSGTTRKRMLLSNDVTPADGQIPIGNGTDYTVATITAGTGISVTNGSGTITIAATQTTGDNTPTLLDGNTNLSTSGFYVFNGSTATWTLPPVGGNTGKTFHIKNRGSSNLDVNSNASGNDIFTSSAVATFSIAPGQSVILNNDGTYFNVY